MKPYILLTPGPLTTSETVKEATVSYTHLDVYKRQAFRCKNDISFNIHNWVCLKMTPKNTPEK